MVALLLPPGSRAHAHAFGIHPTARKRTCPARHRTGRRRRSPARRRGVASTGG
ncbi:hypothetical protein EBESD8_15160 [Rhodococcus aetherivorans]|nr:hypothetical protein EBESD8_15160 [Rhodococcus aetherivorans]